MNFYLKSAYGNCPHELLPWRFIFPPEQKQVRSFLVRHVFHRPLFLRYYSQVRTEFQFRFQVLENLLGFATRACDIFPFRPLANIEFFNFLSIQSSRRGNYISRSEPCLRLSHACKIWFSEELLISKLRDISILFIPL